MPCAWRAARVVPRGGAGQLVDRLVGEAEPLGLAQQSRGVERHADASASARASRRSARSRCRNQRSMRVSSWISSTLMPSRSACAIAKIAQRRRDCAAARAGRRTRTRPGRGPCTPMSSMRSAFWSTSGNVRPIAITSPTLFISLPMRVEAPLELAEVPARHLADEVVERRLEERGGAPRDAVRDLGQRVAERDLGGDVGERIAGGLARERARARQARVDLDDAVVDADRDRARTGCCTRRRCRGGGSSGSRSSAAAGTPRRQRLRRRDDDRLAGVDPQRIEVLHVADGDAVVARVAHDFVLDLLPAAQALLDQHLRHAAGEGAPQRARRARPRSRRCRCPCRRARSRRAASPASRSRDRRARRLGDVRRPWLRAVLTPISSRRSTKSSRSSVSRIACDRRAEHLHAVALRGRRAS